MPLYKEVVGCQFHGLEPLATVASDMAVLFASPALLVSARKNTILKVLAIFALITGAATVRPVAL
jgi:hypothetical protein